MNGKLTLLRALTLFLLLFSAVSASGGAAKARRACVAQVSVSEQIDFFTILPRAFTDEELSRPTPIEAHTETKQTVRFVRSVSGELPGKQLEFEKIGAYWFSRAADRPGGESQFDPRFFAMVLSGETAFFFDTAAYGENGMLTADAVRFMHHLKSINLELEEMQRPLININFDLQEQTGVIANRQYLRNVRARLAIPLANKGALAVHDEIHKLATLAPPEMMLHFADQAAIYLDFVDWMTELVGKNDALTPHTKRIMYKRLELLLHNLVRRIDAATGRIGLLLGMQKSGSFTASSPAHERLKTEIFELTGLGQSAFEILKTDAVRTLHGTKTAGLIDDGKINPSSLRGAEVAETFRIWHELRLPSLYVRRTQMTGEEFARFIYNRIEEIREAVRRAAAKRTAARLNADALSPQ